MKFSQLVAVVAFAAFSAQAIAANDAVWVQSEDIVTSDTQSQPQGVVILNSNTNSASAAQRQPVQQPLTIVEATPVQESRAEAMRKARQNAEMATEQKIVEKLEEDRLREEQERANRLFGNSFSQPVQQQTIQQTQPQTFQQATPPAEDVIVDDRLNKAEQKPAQVTIEKIEIVQPAAVVVEQDDHSSETLAPVAKSEMKTQAAEDKAPSRFYVGGVVGGVNYDASNVKSNYAAGFSIGSIIDNRWGVQAGYLYSNHYIDTFWKPNLYSELDQHDISASAKYYILSGDLKPYVGGGITYILRKYSDRVRNNAAWTANPNTEAEDTQAMNFNLLAGADFMLSDHLILGGGIEWSKNFANNNGIEFSNYGLPDNTKALEEIDYYTISVGAKFLF